MGRSLNAFFEANLEGVSLSVPVVRTEGETRYPRSTVTPSELWPKRRKANGCLASRPFGTSSGRCGTICHCVPCGTGIFDGDFHPSELWLPPGRSAHQANQQTPQPVHRPLQRHWVWIWTCPIASTRWT